LIPSHVLPAFGSGNAGSGATASGTNGGGGGGGGGQATGLAVDPLCSPASLFVSTAADSGRWGVASGTS
jgi:hypothetical protein